MANKKQVNILMLFVSFLAVGPILMAVALEGFSVMSRPGPYVLTGVASLLLYGLARIK